jgi:hypothetical protein
MTNLVYEKLLEQLAGGEMTELQRSLFGLLKAHPEGLTRPELVQNIYGYWPANINGNADDRKIRKAIERMRRRLFPIVSTSSKPGYRLDTSREAVMKMIGELQHRKTRLQEQINAAAKFYEIPEYQEPVNASQMRMPL